MSDINKENRRIAERLRAVAREPPAQFHAPSKQSPVRDSLHVVSMCISQLLSPAISRTRDRSVQSPTLQKKHVGASADGAKSLKTAPPSDMGTRRMDELPKNHKDQHWPPRAPPLPSAAETHAAAELAKAVSIANAAAL